MMMALSLLLCSGCDDVDVADFQGCSPIPNTVTDSPPDFGAACDNFLTSNQLILTHVQWVATQASWIKAGSGVECVPTSAIANLKKEVEKLCSVAKCTYTQKAILMAGLDRLAATATTAKGESNGSETQAF
jgi:hypothetical protein